MTSDAIARRAGARLTIDLDAIVANWRALAARAAPAECSAVVKADAYGLGAVRVASALLAAGCKTFFVALLEEGIVLRAALGPGPRIGVLNGTPPGTAPDFTAATLLPVINTLGQLAEWRAEAARLGHPCSVALQVETGMSRFGLPAADVAAIASDPAFLAGLKVELLMSHLACADEPEHSANEAQRAEFERLRAILPAAPASLANSSGIFLGKTYHHALVRPGAALYGINPTPHLPNPMRQVVQLEARIVQLRTVDPGTGIGYSHAATATRPTKLATLSIGYADGWPRSASTASAFADRCRLPFIGRVSMDSVIVDTTDCTAPLVEGDFARLIDPEQTVDDIAALGGTIGYEILTRLGSRFDRRYISSGQST